MADARQHIDTVDLEGHARRAPVAQAAALQGTLECGALVGHAGRQPFEDADQGGAVGLAGGEVAQDHEAPTLAAPATCGSAPPRTR